MSHIWPAQRLAKTFPICGQGQDRTADLPRFRLAVTPSDHAELTATRPDEAAGGPQLTLSVKSPAGGTNVQQPSRCPATATNLGWPRTPAHSTATDLTASSSHRGVLGQARSWRATSVPDRDRTCYLGSSSQKMLMMVAAVRRSATRRSNHGLGSWNVLAVLLTR